MADNTQQPSSPDEAAGADLSSTQASAQASASAGESGVDSTDKPSHRVPQSRRRGARYRARRRATDILYEAENRDVDPVAIVEDRVELARNPDFGVAPIAEYTKVVVTGVAEELDSVDAVIERYLSEDWELFRIPAVDRAIMRVAVWEMLFNPDIDAATALTEGVELASEYSTAVAAPYIHAVLDNVAQSTSADNPMSAGFPDEDSLDEDSVEEPVVVNPEGLGDCGLVSDSSEDNAPDNRPADPAAEDTSEFRS